MALRQIGLLELELQRQRCLTHDAQLARDRQAERTRWERVSEVTTYCLFHLLFAYWVFICAVLYVVMFLVFLALW